MPSNKKGIANYFFLMPAAVIYFCIIVIPAFYSLYLSFFKWNGVSPKKQFVGIQNYINVITKDQVFKTATINNIVWIFLSIIFTVTIALCLAMLINRSFRGRAFFRAIFYFPYILSGIVVAIIWTWVYQPQLGLFNSIVRTLGMPGLAKAWLADTKTAFFAVYIAALWQGVGAPMIIFLAGLQTVPKELQEAAYIDGATKLRSFFSITIPMLKETFVIVFAIQIISAMKVFDIIYGMTGGGPAQSTQTMATWMVLQTFSFANVGIGTAISWIMTIVLMIVIIPFVLFMARD